MEADGIAVSFLIRIYSVRGAGDSHSQFRTIVRKDDGSISDGIVYVIPSNGLRTIKNLFK